MTRWYVKTEKGWLPTISQYQAVSLMLLGHAIKRTPYDPNADDPQSA